MSGERFLLDSYLKTLKLPTMRAEYEALARKCSQANAPYEDFLQQLAELEVQRRTAVAIERRLKQAEFPMVKELSDYRFADVPKLNKKYVLVPGEQNQSGDHRPARCREDASGHCVRPGSLSAGPCGEVLHRRTPGQHLRGGPPGTNDPETGKDDPAVRSGHCG
jgi:hypothetical protein